MNLSSNIIDSLNKCGIFLCQKYFWSTFLITSLLIILINIYIYGKLSTYVVSTYPDIRCDQIIN